MKRFGIFVDAGYLFAAGGKLCHGVTARERLALNATSLHEALVQFAGTDCGLEHLRTYWYDGARDARPTAEQIAIANLNGVKLRLGRLTQSGQKGVDSRIVRDLIILSVERAISTAYLLGGDEDLREGVSEAQERGVQVVLVGVEPLNEQNISRTLAMESDKVVTLDRAFVEPHLALIEPAAIEATEGQPQPVPGAPLESDPEMLGRAFATSWFESAPPEAVAELKRDAPRIPSELDRALLAQGRVAFGGSIDDESRKKLRQGFWQAIESLTGSA
ncbi:MAG TPA: NYN domain-containing protein [Gaiellaceae bacterium]|nr:NYN domain-containing protein [Gaiellaceae bacterium]